MHVHTWEEAARNAADFIHITDITLLDTELIAHLEDCITIMRTEGSKLNIYLDIATNALHSYAYHTDQAADIALHHILQIVAAKQHDYGTDNITVEGHTGLRVRMHDKVARLKNLQQRANRGEHAKNEAVCDTLMDLVGYSLIGIMLWAGTFTLPLEADR